MAGLSKIPLDLPLEEPVVEDWSVPGEAEGECVAVAAVGEDHPIEPLGMNTVGPSAPDREENVKEGATPRGAREESRQLRLIPAASARGLSRAPVTKVVVAGEQAGTEVLVNGSVQGKKICCAPEGLKPGSNPAPHAVALAVATEVREARESLKSAGASVPAPG